MPQSTDDDVDNYVHWNKTSESINKFENSFLFPCLRLMIFSITNAAGIFWNTQCRKSL